MHSELEDFFERLALSTLTMIKTKIDNDIPCRGTASLLVFYRTDQKGSAPSTIGEIQETPFSLRALRSSHFEATQRIVSNKGIKTHNILAMFIPIGVRESDIDSDLLIDLNTLGTRRGDVAHKSIHYATSLPDPADDKALVERIIGSLSEFEKLLKLCS